MGVRVERIPVTTDGSGGATVYGEFSGEILEIVNPSTALNAATTTMDTTITRKDDDGPILAFTNTDGPWRKSPRQATHDTAGAALLYASGGTAVSAPIAVTEGVKIVLAQAGVSKTSEILVFYRED